MCLYTGMDAAKVRSKGLSLHGGVYILLLLLLSLL